jgi:hypothetical protein
VEKMMSSKQEKLRLIVDTLSKDRGLHDEFMAALKWAADINNVKLTKADYDKFGISVEDGRYNKCLLPACKT